MDKLKAILILKIVYYSIAALLIVLGHPFFAIYCFIAGSCVGMDNKEVSKNVTSPDNTIDTLPPDTSGGSGKPPFPSLTHKKVDYEA